MTSEQTLTEIHSMLRALTAHLGVKPAGAAKAAAPGAPAPAPASTVADDRELDSQYGDPEIRKDPPRYTGPSMVGKKYSETNAEYLETLAGFLDWKAGKNEAEGTPDKLKYAGYDRRDASRARGWMARLLANPAQTTIEGAGVAPAAAPAGDGFESEPGEDDIPF